MRYFGGLDLSFSGTGLVILGEDGKIALRMTIHTGTKMPHRQRLVLIGDTIVSFLKGYASDGNSLVLAKESPAHGARFGVHLAGEVHGAVEYAMEKAGLMVPYEMAPASLKKFATGRGIGEKGDVKMWILAKWGEKFADNNQADAYTLARVAGSIAGVFLMTSKHEAECIKTILAGAGMKAEAKAIKMPKKDARSCACGKRMKTGIEFESGRCAECIRAVPPTEGGTPQ